MRCQNPRCFEDAAERTGTRGPRPKYCSGACKTAASRYAANAGSVPKWLIAQYIERELEMHHSDARAYDCLMSLCDAMGVDVDMTRVNREIDRQAKRRRQCTSLFDAD